MEMLQLRYFYETAMAESIAKTAPKYMVPASSVSASIKRLEQELGVELFVRTSNRITLSEKGKEFLVSVSNILSQLETSVQVLSVNSGERQTISILARCTRTILTRWIMRFYHINPSVRFIVEFEDVPENYKNYDIIISEPAEALEAYAFFPWRRFDIRVEAMETDHLSRDPITLNVYYKKEAHEGNIKLFLEQLQTSALRP